MFFNYTFYEYFYTYIHVNNNFAIFNVGKDGNNVSAKFVRRIIS